PAAAAALGCGCVTPPHMEVANAVGAIAGVVAVTEEVTIRRMTDGTYVAYTSEGRGEFGDIESATDSTRQRARELAADKARERGAAHTELKEQVDEFVTNSSWDMPVVLERRLTIKAFGRPRSAS
ncbi:MAG: hypothetical protein CVT83_08665, partial [Alphaproteobacteria bacterium HGW-Alphaproteobacteria-5]